MYAKVLFKQLPHFHLNGRVLTALCCVNYPVKIIKATHMLIYSISYSIVYHKWSTVLKVQQGFIIRNVAEMYPI